MSGLGGQEFPQIVDTRYLGGQCFTHGGDDEDDEIMMMMMETMR